MTTETLDKLFLELSQFTRATTAKELALQKDAKRLSTLLDWWFGGVPKHINVGSALCHEELVAMLDANPSPDEVAP
jgi:hypothetical protein